MSMGGLKVGGNVGEAGNIYKTQGPGGAGGTNPNRIGAGSPDRRLPGAMGEGSQVSLADLRAFGERGPMGPTTAGRRTISLAERRDNTKRLFAMFQSGSTNTAKIRELSQVGVNGELQDGRGNTILHLAIMYGDAKIVEAMLYYADVNAKNKDGNTPLHLAIMNGNAEIVAALLAYRANPDVPDKYGRTPLHLAIEKGMTEVVTALLDAKANPDAPDENGNAPMHLAVAKGDTAAIVALLAKGADINVRGENNYTPLHLAAMYGDKATMETLIAHKANMSALGGYDLTPLDLAEDPDIQDLLRKYGALTGDGVRVNTDKLFALLQGERSEANTAKIVDLIEAGVDFNALSQYGATPLHFAVTYNSPEIVEALTKARAPINALDEYGQTPLDLTADPDMQALLTDKGALTGDAVRARQRDELGDRADQSGGDFGGFW